jgi:hypothetical protein
MPRGAPSTRRCALAAVAAVGHAWQDSRAAGECDMGSYLVDILAVGFFIIEWAVYAVTLDYTVYGSDSLSARMHIYREVWIRRLLDRETRMVDTQIMASLQNGTAFFASTCLRSAAGWRCCDRPAMRWPYWARCLSISALRRRSGRSNASGWC